MQETTTMREHARVLCVEDDAASRAVVGAALRDYAPDFATNGEEAVVALNSAPFDLIVLDHWLPDYSGVAICREVRRLDPHVPIIFWTVAEKERLAARALGAGASVYLEKTPEYERLRSAAAELLAQAEQQLEGAKAAALRVVEELKARYGSIASGNTMSQHDVDRALTRFGETRVRAAFIAGGGSLAQFQKWWSELGESK
jgi:DNA-binding response OmpR family regulator